MPQGLPFPKHIIRSADDEDRFDEIPRLSGTAAAAHIPRSAAKIAIRVLFSMQKDKKAKKKGSLVQRELPR